MGGHGRPSAGFWRVARVGLAAATSGRRGKGDEQRTASAARTRGGVRRLPVGAFHGGGGRGTEPWFLRGRWTQMPAPAAPLWLRPPIGCLQYPMLLVTPEAGETGARDAVDSSTAASGRGSPETEEDAVADSDRRVLWMGWRRSWPAWTCVLERGCYGDPASPQSSTYGPPVLLPPPPPLQRRYPAALAASPAFNGRRPGSTQRHGLTLRFRGPFGQAFRRLVCGLGGPAPASTPSVSYSSASNSRPDIQLFLQ
ncbi:hypothetical protein BDV95DRAFT_193259 [Massariosphaeria phaeospora]|uniref:Uncharacterized protein n=1 Tax=Massariosphaeria phaeospora TaxID=100035 RepID=A0A7C8M3E8_9PLEO|nr:hypothetical protein BDV95DRAFT_193259 [Massariosphaeria phaeospora]